MTPLAPTLDPLLLFVLFLNYLRLKVVNFNPDEAVLILSDSSEQEKQCRISLSFRLMRML